MTSSVPVPKSKEFEAQRFASPNLFEPQKSDSDFQNTLSPPTQKPSRFFAPALIGAATLGLILIGFVRLPFFQKNGLIQEFSASLLQSTELEFTLPEGTFALPSEMRPALANSSDHASVFSVQIALPPYTELVQYQNTYLLRCTADAKKVPGQNACARK